MHPRTKELHDLMAAYSLTIADVARIVDRSENTVHQWHARRVSQYSRPIPDHALGFLRSELESGRYMGKLSGANPD